MSSVCSDHFSPSPSLIPLGTSSDLFLPFFLRPTINAQTSIPHAAPGLLPGVMAFDERTYEVSLGTIRMKHSGSPARFWLGAKQALVTIKACLWGIKIANKNVVLFPPQTSASLRGSWDSILILIFPGFLYLQSLHTSMPWKTPPPCAQSWMILLSPFLTGHP